HHLLGELDAAQRTYLRALALQQKNADVIALCWAEGGLVDVRTRRGDTAEALDTLRQTLEIASANDLRLAQAAMCSTLMTVHALVGERGAVEEVYRAGVELCREQGDDHVIAELHATAAELRALRGDADSAQDALRAAEALAGASPGPVPAIRTAIARGRAAATTRRPRAQSRRHADPRDALAARGADARTRDLVVGGGKHPSLRARPIRAPSGRDPHQRPRLAHQQSQGALRVAAARSAARRLPGRARRPALARDRCGIGAVELSLHAARPAEGAGVGGRIGSDERRAHRHRLPARAADLHPRRPRGLSPIAAPR